MVTYQGGAAQAGLMSLEGLSGLVNRIIAWADRLQRRHGVLGFPYAVVKKYGDDEGGRSDQALDAISNAAGDSPMPPDEGMPPA